MTLHIIGGGLAGSEAAWQAASLGVPVVIHEMRPVRPTDVNLDRGERGRRRPVAAGEPGRRPHPRP